MTRHFHLLVVVKLPAYAGLLHELHLQQRFSRPHVVGHYHVASTEQSDPHSKCSVTQDGVMTLEHHGHVDPDTVRVTDGFVAVGTK